MGDTLITVIAIFLAAILMFVFPLMALSERTDDMAQLSVQTATTEFVDDVRTTGNLCLLICPLFGLYTHYSIYFHQFL